MNFINVATLLITIRNYDSSVWINFSVKPFLNCIGYKGTIDSNLYPWMKQMYFPVFSSYCCCAYCIYRTRMK